MRRIKTVLSFALAVSIASYAQNQNATPQNDRTSQQPIQPVAQQQGRSPGGDIGSGSGDIGKGVGKGAGNLAEGTGRGAVDIVTLHPINGAVAVGKGAGSAGKNIGVGTAKGTGKILKGTGRGIKKIF